CVVSWPSVAILLPRKQVKSRHNAFLYVRMSMIRKNGKLADFAYENAVFRGCAPGVTRTPDPRIRNPLLYPAELRAQNERGQYVALESQKSSAKQGESPQTSNVTHLEPRRTSRGMNLGKVPCQ